MGEIPHLKELVELHADQPFAIVGVNTDKDPEAYRAGVAQHGVTWRSAFDAAHVVEAWAVNYYPTIYVLDVEGRIRHLNLHGDDLEAAVAALLAEAAAADEGTGDGRGAADGAHAGGTDVPADSAPAADAYERLATDHAAAVEAWEASWRELKGKERIEARKADPSRDFLGDFERLAAAGDRRATLWVARHLKDASDLTSKELRPRLADLYDGLVGEPGAQAAAIAEGVLAEKRLLERAHRLDLLAGLEPHLTGDRPVAARVLAARADLLTDRKATDDERAAGEALRARLLADYLDTTEGIALWGEANAGAYEGVGSVVPDFPAVDTNGEAFRLSDYRGRVVLLDFWGFW